jgi:hypothetical protein
MLKFILKDIRLHRKTVMFLGVLYPIYIGWFGSSLSNPRIYPFFAAVMFVFVAVILYTREDKFKAVGWSLGLPATRRQIILGRYLTSWSLMIGLGILSAAVALLIPAGKLGVSDLIGPAALLALLSYMTAVLGVLMPLTVQFGLAGILVFLIGLQVLGVGAMLFRVSFQNLKAAIALPWRAVAAALDAWGPAAAAAIVLGVLFAANWASFELSSFLFKRKDF